MLKRLKVINVNTKVEYIFQLQVEEGWDFIQGDIQHVIDLKILTGLTEVTQWDKKQDKYIKFIITTSHYEINE